MYLRPFYIIKNWRREGHPANRNKQNCHTNRCRLTSGICPTLPQCGKEDVFVHRLCSRDVKDCVLVTLNVNDDDEN